MSGTFKRHIDHDPRLHLSDTGNRLEPCRERLGCSLDVSEDVGEPIPLIVRVSLERASDSSVLSDITHVATPAARTSAMAAT